MASGWLVFDESMDPAEDITFIKLNVEGHELKALLGSKKIIEKQKPIIMFEQHKNDFIDGSTDVIELLRDFGYKSFVIVEKYPSSEISVDKTSEIRLFGNLKR